MERLEETRITWQELIVVEVYTVRAHKHCIATTYII